MFDAPGTAAGHDRSFAAMTLVMENVWPRGAAWAGGELSLGGIGVGALAAEFVWARRLLDRLKKGGAALGDRIFGKRKSLAE